MFVKSFRSGEYCLFWKYTFTQRFCFMLGSSGSLYKDQTWINTQKDHRIQCWNFQIIDYDVR